MSSVRVIENFVRVARTGSLTKVARDLDVTPSALSKQITQLERELNAPLMVRGRNQDLTLTPEGKVYFDGVVPLLEGLKEVEKKVADFKKGRRPVRIRAPLVLTRAFLVPGLRGFSAKHHLTFHHVSDRSSDPAEVSLSISAPDWGAADEHGAPPDNVLHSLGTQGWVAVVAADSSLRNAQIPQAIRNVCALHLGQPLEEWTFVSGSQTIEKRFHLQAVGDEPEVLASYIEDRTGVAFLPKWAAADMLQSAKYSRILKDWTISPARGSGEIVLSVSPAVRDSLDVTDLIAHLERQLRDVDGSSEPGPGSSSSGPPRAR